MYRPYMTVNPHARPLRLMMNPLTLLCSHYFTYSYSSSKWRLYRSSYRNTIPIILEDLVCSTQLINHFEAYADFCLLSDNHNDSEFGRQDVQEISKAL